MEMKKHKTKHILSVLAATMVGFSFLFLYYYIGVNQRKKTYEDSKWIATQQSRNTAMAVESYFIKPIMIARSLATQSILYYKEKVDRTKIVSLLSKYAKENPEFVAIWTMWEPNFYDGKDVQFKGNPYFDSEGHLSVTFFYHNDSIYIEKVSPDDYQEFFYTIPKETLQEIVLEPYNYQYQGYPYEFYETTVVVPIIINSTFAGIIGIDIDLKNIQQKLNKIKLLNKGQLTLVSAYGEIVAHSDSNFFAKNIFEIVNPSDTLMSYAFKQGIEFNYETYSEFSGETVFRTLYPINIGKSNNRWFIILEINKKLATLRSENMFYISIGVLIFGLLLTIYLVHNIFERLKYEKELIRAKELAENKEYELQKMYYELQASEEELRATNEELYATSEALTESNQELTTAKEKAEEASKLKTAFLHNLSHEIRTPLNAIFGFTQMLSSNNLSSEESKHFIQIIQNSSQQLVSVVNDIITISSIETGQERLNNVNFRLNKHIDGLHQTFSKKTSEKGIEFKVVKGLSDQDDEILADDLKLSQILKHLIYNAIKFTQVGFIEFGYVVKNNNIEFFVKDSGMGIDNSKHEIIFERFTHASESICSQYGGAGLGLAICKGFVTLMGGNIWVESELNKGTAFYFTIPYHPVNTKSNLIFANETLVKVNDKVKTILIAEDDINNFKLLKAILKDFDYQIIHVEDGRKAIELCQNEPSICMVLMDIKLPELDGVSATKLIKEFKPKLPIIAQTAYATLDDIEKNRDIFDAYITKPIDIIKLKKIISDLCSNEEKYESF